MNISMILSEDSVFPCVEAESKRRIFEYAAKFLAEKENLDEAKIFEALWERENLGSTGYGEGIAVPHARIEGVNRVSALFLRLKEEIDFDSRDGKGVDLVAVVISPEQSGGDHLQALSAFSRVLKNSENCQKLRLAKSAHEIYLILNQ